MNRKGLVFVALGFVLLSLVFEARIEAVERRLLESEKLDSQFVEAIHKIVVKLGEIQNAKVH